MKSRPIIYSGDMIRAILEGRKTQTRRTRGLDKINANPDAWQFMGIDDAGEYVFWNPTYYDEHNGLSIGIKCPYGQVGDQLWVRETFTLTQFNKPVYRADAKDKDGLRWDSIEPNDPQKEVLWRSPRFMFRWASRITTENTKIRVERVQDITTNDLIAEGIEPPLAQYDSGSMPRIIIFEKLWDSLNAKRGYSWEFNPCIWVIEFKETKK